jgi:riboflavin synthase
VFTGIVEERGRVVRVEGPALTVEAVTVGADAEIGSSIAVSGVCLTVVSNEPSDGDRGRLLSFDLAPETLARTTLGGLRSGDGVNLERPVTLLTRLGGHLVQGHVDGEGEVREVRSVQDGCEMTFGLPEGAARYVVEKGSIAVDGVSLTVNAIPSAGVIQVSLIPFTLQHTTLGERKAGDRVHLEADTIGKYVAELLRARGDLGGS